MTTFDLYRRSTIGMCLTETFDEMVSNGTLGPKLAIQVVVQFVKSMTEALETQVKSKVIIKTCIVQNRLFFLFIYTYSYCANNSFFILVFFSFSQNKTKHFITYKYIIIITTTTTTTKP
ncbi:hypothetical protein J5N97_020608 [Dioscorea zingiberensis]|uniref:Transcription initiation factor IIA subunit 2 n=1 Tax=Dioscorea zingiberensis TaxID=325984 RepID=A0A9D5HDL1_9LILI|nr:hypothetical protein J5N97_020608 [Dioscorea zingiberensis]